MFKLQKSLILVTLLALVACQSTGLRKIASESLISESTQQLVTWETTANAVSKRSDEVIRVEHYEIPLRLLQKDFDQNLDPKIRDSLIFSKNGESYVRWLINPEDSKWHLEVKAFLDKHKIDSTPKKLFDGYLTASRSMILVNPTNGASFSLKVSTDKTGGKWTDKKQTWEDAVQVRSMNKWLHETLPKMQNETLVVLEEPAAFGIKDLDQGMILRSLNDLPNDKFFYMPAFSVLHEGEGARIAKLNGSTNPVEFWNKHLVEPLGSALAEYFAMTGAWYDSPHAQNFLVELDREMKPTGRIVLRDLGDAYLLEDFVKNTKHAGLLKNWDPKNILSNKMITGIGLLHGNSAPGWMFSLEYKEYGWNFYRAFEKRFSEITNIPLSELSKTESKEVLFSYTRKTYQTTSDGWKKFLKFANCMNGETRTISGEKCPDFYQQRHILAVRPFHNDCFGAANALINL